LTKYQSGISHQAVHVIAKPALITFYTLHPDAKSSLLAWHALISGQNFSDFLALRRVFASADAVDGLTVFNIGGNKYRLIAAIHYNRRKVFIRAILTHADYDLGKWKRKGMQ
jgi:mRNA interferase HigB